MSEEKPISIVFRDNLNYYLGVSGLQQKELAEHLNISPVAVHKWLSGKSFPTLEKLDAICDCLNVSRFQLVMERTEAMELLHAISKLSQDGKKEVEKYVNLLTASGLY